MTTTIKNTLAMIVHYQICDDITYIKGFKTRGKNNSENTYALIKNHLSIKHDNNKNMMHLLNTLKYICIRTLRKN